MKPELEGLTERILLSASPTVPLPASPSMASTMEQPAEQRIALVQSEVSGIVQALTQEIVQAEAYLLQRLDQILGIAPNIQNLSLKSPIPNAASGTTTTQPSADTQPSAPVAPDAAPDGPDAAEETGFLWDPTQGTNASVAANWDYNGQSQVGNPNAKVPGQIPGKVIFDPALTNPATHPDLHGKGASPITWDYNPANSFAMQLGGQSTYVGKQTINAGVRVDVTSASADGTPNGLKSKLYLFFVAPPEGKSTVFQIDGDSTITNMNLTGSYKGLFLINGGTIEIARPPGYTETVGVNITVNPGATLEDYASNTLKYTNDNVQLLIKGTMKVTFSSNPANPVINNGGNADDYISVWGGTLLYLGSGGITDTMIMPVAVVNGGTFRVSISKEAGQQTGGKLIVQGANSSTQDASVYMTGATSSVQLAWGDTLECDSGYKQANGTLETTDANTCTLQSGQSSNYGTVNITGGYLLIDQPHLTQYATFNVNCSTLNFAGTYCPVINAQAQGAGSCDLLNVNGTTNLQGASLYVTVNNAPPNGGSGWVIIQDNPATNSIQGGAGLPITTNPQTNLNGTVNNNQYLLSF